jgi:beta-lactamase superfamily II metal-dependent hydrolase
MDYLRSIPAFAATLVILIAACSPDTSGGNDPTEDTGVDVSGEDTNELDVTASDTGAADTAVDTESDASDTETATDAADTRDTSDVQNTACAPLPQPPTDALEPAPGELFYMQLGLGGFSLGESALVVGPEGTIVAFDVGNDAHDDEIVDALGELEQQMSAAGFPQRDADTIDHIVVTHYHADHGDGVTDLLENIALAGTVVTRGMYDLTEAGNSATAGKLCDAVTANAGAGISLCTGAEAAPCDEASQSGTYPSTSCPGLSESNLLEPNDGSDTSYLPLGTSRLAFLGVNGWMGGESYADQVGPFDAVDGNGENARSILALLEHGRFRMLLTGDLTGGGDDTDDVESFYASRLSAVSDIDARGIDVLHAGHHGRKTSTNTTWLARLFPADQQPRNVVMGISTAHLNSPHDEVLRRIESQGLGGGSIWTTRIATGGDSVDSLINADGGRIVLSTVEGGDGYVVQALGESGQVIESRVFEAARCQ